MSTLYDILGLGRSATAEQIDHAYRQGLEILKAGQGLSAEQDINRLRALKEAYGVLSSPARRKSYDERLSPTRKIEYEVVERRAPWVKILLAAALLAGAAAMYKHQDNKAQVERAAIEAAKAKAEAEAAEKLAAAEQVRLEREKLAQAWSDEAVRRREMEQARREGQSIHAQLQQQDARIAGEKELAARQEQRQEQQMKAEREREERAARARVQSDNAAMQRALNMPVRR